MVAEISVGIVNYRSAELLLGAVETLLQDAECLPRGVDDLDIAVVENASGDDSLFELESRLPRRVKLVVNTLNVGYARANNQAFGITQSRLHLVLNPDCRVVPGMLNTLRNSIDGLSTPGLVGPNVSMDVEGQILLPPNEMVDPYIDTICHLSRTSDAIARWNGRRRARFAHAIWTATSPIRVPMLSGGCFMGRRIDFVEHGLFDAGYPLYYEDTDLFRRFVSRGLDLWQIPGARVVHFFSRSAGQRVKASSYRHALSARRYFENWFGMTGLGTHDYFRERAAAHARDDISPWSIVELAPSRLPPTLDIQGPPGTYLEIAGSPKFTLAAGAFPGRVGPYMIPRAFFDGLGPAHYWVRSVDPSTGETLAAWRFTKSV